jgi:hypothetical protein
MGEVIPLLLPRRQASTGSPGLQFEPPPYRLEAEVHRLITELAMALGVRDCVLMRRPYRRRQWGRAFGPG